MFNHLFGHCLFSFFLPGPGLPLYTLMDNRGPGAGMLSLQGQIQKVLLVPGAGIKHWS